MKLKQYLGLELNPLHRLQSKTPKTVAYPRLPQVPVDMGYKNINPFSNTIGGPLTKPQRDFSLIYPFPSW